MRYAAFLTLVEEYQRSHPSLRWGQCVMNVLFSLQPRLYESLLSSDLDCFYTTDASEVQRTLTYLATQWDAEGDHDHE